MPAGIGTFSGDGLSSGSGTLGLDCPACRHQHDYQDEKQTDGSVGRMVYDCSHCQCMSEDFIKSKE